MFEKQTSQPRLSNISLDLASLKKKKIAAHVLKRIKDSKIKIKKKNENK